ncbi:MAG: hypothetical protein R2822_27250 [Spirosomataceae bacterium]
MKEAIHIDQNGGRGRYYMRGQSGNLLNYDPFVLDLSSRDVFKVYRCSPRSDRLILSRKWRVEQMSNWCYTICRPNLLVAMGGDCAKDGIQFYR